MALKLGTLFYDIGADTSKLRGAERRVKRSTDSMNRSFKNLGRVIGVAFGVESARRIILMADEMRLLDVRIRNVTRDNEEFIRSQRRLIKTANDVGQAFSEVVNVFQAIKIGAKEVDATNEQVLLLTDAVQKLGVIGGSSATAMRFSMRQFGQAMAGGIVRAEEFNSIVENTPLLAQAIAEGMGLTVGALRRATIEGRVLSEDVFNAILGQTEDIQKRFEDMPLTVSRASRALANEFAQSLKLVNEELATTTALADIIQRAADSTGDFTRNILFHINAVQAGWQLLVALITARWQSFMERIRFDYELLSSSSDNVTSKIAFFFKFAAKSIELGFATMFATVKNGLADLLDSFQALPDAGPLAALKEAAADSAFELRSSASFAKQLKGEVDELIDAEKARKIAVADQGAEAKAQHEIRMQEIQDELEAKQAAAIFEVLLDAQRIKAAQALRDAQGEGGGELQLAQKPKPRVDGQEVLAGTVSGVDKLLADMGDETQALVNKLRERNQEILSVTKEGEDARSQLIRTSREKFSRDMVALEQQHALIGLQAIGGFLDQLYNVLSAGGKRNSALLKALFIANKAVQVATIIAATEVAAARAPAEAGPIFGMPLAAFIRATGYASAGLVAGLSIGQAIGGGRQSGGLVFPGMMHPINETGGPEVLQQGSRSFLLPGSRGGNVVSSGDMEMGRGGGINISVINSGPPITVDSASISRGEVLLEISASEDRAVERVNASLASGRGKSARSLNQGFKIERNIN